MLTPYLPYPPSSGGQIRTLNLLKYLSRNNQITLIALYKNKSEKKYSKHLKKYCKEIYLCKRAEKPWQINNILKAVFLAYPFLIIRNFSKEAKQTIKLLLKKESFDVIHAETFYIMPHLPKTSIPILLVEQTIEYKVYQHFVNSLPFIIKPFLYFDILKLKFWERYYWKKAKFVATVSQSDKKEIKKLEPKIKTVIVPNGTGDEMISIKSVRKNLTKPVLFFIGNFYWLQNVEAANFLIKNVFPHISSNIPQAKLLIAGQNAKNKIKYQNNKNLEIINIDSNDGKVVKKLYEKATLFLAPIFGPGGTRLKLLAAMATRVPIISTKTGIEGLKLKEKENVLIAKTPKEFIAKSTLILSDKKLYSTIQKNAYKLIQDEYNWKKIAVKLKSVYKKLTL